MTTQRTPATDQDEIINLKTSYGHLIDRLVLERRPNDADRLRGMFTEDAIVDMSFSGVFGVYQGHDEIVRLFLEEMTPGYHWMWHSFHTPAIGLDGDTAHGV